MIACLPKNTYELLDFDSCNKCKNDVIFRWKKANLSEVKNEVKNSPNIKMVNVAKIDSKG
jgi:hypothetical protein